MSKCGRCGSYAINHHHHGRDGSDPDLCDVCYWRKRAEPTQENIQLLVEGMEVSVDVSTDDHDADHRYFGTISEAMENPDSKHGVILLVQNAEPNFTKE